MSDDRWNLRLYRAGEDEPFHSDYIEPGLIAQVSIQQAMGDERVERIEIVRAP